MSEATAAIDFPPDDATSWELVPDFRWARELGRGSLLGLGVVLVLLAHQLWSPGFALVDDDAVSSWQPIMTDFARQLGEGRFPVWSHHTSCGYPLLGWPQPSFTYPPMWIAHGIGWLLGIDSGDFLIVTFFHYFVAAAASFVYLRRFGVYPLAAATGALGNALAGTLLGLGACWPTYVFTAAMWPIVFLTIEELRAGRAFRFWTLLLGLVGGLSFLYLDAMIMIKFTTFAGLYLLLRVDRTSWLRLFGACVVAGLIAIVIGLVQTVPSTEIIVTSQRMGEGSNNHFTIPPMLWLGLTFPFALLPWEIGEQSVRAAGGLFVGPCSFSVSSRTPLVSARRAAAGAARSWPGSICCSRSATGARCRTWCSTCRCSTSSAGRSAGRSRPRRPWRWQAASESISRCCVSNGTAPGALSPGAHC